MTFHRTSICVSGAALCLAGALALATSGSIAAVASPSPEAPRVIETKRYALEQTVTLHDVPADADSVELWIPIPSDAAWQRVLDRRIVDAPAGWRIVRQPESRGDLVHVKTSGAAAVDGTISVIVRLEVERDSPKVEMESQSHLSGDSTGAAHDELEAGLAKEYLRLDAPNMAVTPAVRAMADAVCTGIRDPRLRVIRLVHAVGDAADHYSRDPSKPHCGRGSAEDCMENGGGCCTDLHSLFIAMARSQGIPSRIQFGYRLNPAKEGVEFDPSYRCWVETWLPGSGWVATDVVVADSGASAERDGHVGLLDANRVWLWEGRGFNLSPRQTAAAIQTMLAGWAEIDGVTVDPLPAVDGTPPALRRTIRFERLDD